MSGDRGERDNSHELSSFDVLGALPTFPNTTTLGAEPSSQVHHSYGVDGEGLASGTFYDVQEQCVWPYPVVEECERESHHLFTLMCIGDSAETTPWTKLHTRFVVGHERSI